MQFIQLNTPPPPQPIVGTIILENADGQPVWTVTYGVIRQRRERVIAAEDGYYEQQLPDANGIWHYRFSRQRAPLQPVDNTLSDYQYIGPPVAPPAPQPAVCPTCGRPIHE